jgi:NAD-dependent dihydropyrimidine dehydrogenase PreA subunit
MSECPTIVFCNCSYAQVVPEATRSAVLRGLCQKGVAFEAVADLCGECAKNRDSHLFSSPAAPGWESSRKRTAEGGCATGGEEAAPSKERIIIACYPRAVEALFASAGAELGENTTVLNMRTQSAEEILAALPISADGDGKNEAAAAEEVEKRYQELRGRLAADPAGWIPWFPVIDAARCVHCKQCLSFCLFGVYALGEDGKVKVAQPEKCKTHCPACARVCPQAAIIFPKYAGSPINGAPVRPEDIDREKMKTDLAAMLANRNVYEKLRERTGGTPKQVP